MLTNDELTDLIEYDPYSGAIYKEGSYIEVDFTPFNVRPKPLRRQCMGRLPTKPKSFKPSHVGYSLISKAKYDNIISGATDVEGELEYKSGRSVRAMVRPRHAYEMHYKIRKNRTYEVVTYYVIEIIRPYPRLSVKGKQYPVTHLIYLYMGVDLPAGKIPCRDKNYLNFAWDNIKPFENRLAPYKPEPRDKRPVTTTYTHQRCIEAYFGRFRVTIHTNLTYYDTHAQALAGFAKITKTLQGKHKQIANGVRVTRPHNSAYFKP